MVEGQALIEWSPEIGLALSQRFCSWVVPEMDDEYLEASLRLSMPNYEFGSSSKHSSRVSQEIHVVMEEAAAIAKENEMAASRRERKLQEAYDPLKSNNSFKSIKSSSEDSSSEQGSQKTDQNEKKQEDEDNRMTNSK